MIQSITGVVYDYYIIYNHFSCIFRRVPPKIDPIERPVPGFDPDGCILDLTLCVSGSHCQNSKLGPQRTSVHCCEKNNQQRSAWPVFIFHGLLGHHCWSWSDDHRSEQLGVYVHADSSSWHEHYQSGEDVSADSRL